MLSSKPRSFDQSLELIKLFGIISKEQFDSDGASSYILFIPTYSNEYFIYGLKSIKSLIIQGKCQIVDNYVTLSGYRLNKAEQNSQGLFISITTPNVDISGYLCECIIDFYEDK